MAIGRYTIRKVDDNQKEIVQALRQCGFSVAITSIVSGGFPDLVCSKSRICFLAEVKDGRKRKSDRQLTRDQQTFHARWQSEIVILESVDDVRKLNARFAGMGKAAQ